MITKLSVSAAALAALGLAAPAMAENLYGQGSTVDIEVEVEQIAVLEVESASARMFLDDESDPFMGRGSTGGSFDAEDLAVLKLSTNFDIDALEVDFPKVRGGTTADGRIRNFDGSTQFGRAIGRNNGEILGVWPQAGTLSAPNGSIIGGGGGIFGNPADGNPIQVTGPHRDNDTNGFGNGVHYFGLGVSTNWTRTTNDGPMFAEPDVYDITLTATIVPDA